VHDHKFGVCEKCGSKPPDNYKGTPGKLKMKQSVWGGRMIGTNEKDCGTKDTHINFGEFLDSIDYDEADTNCSKADLCIIAGTSMSLRHITHFPFLAKKTVLINLQATPDDDKADLRIWAKCDPVFNGLMERLGITIDPIPVWKPVDAVPIDKIPACVVPFYVQKAKELGDFYNTLEAERIEENLIQIQVPVKNLPSKIIVGNLHEAVVKKKGEKTNRWTIYAKLPDNQNEKLEDYVEFVKFQLHPTFTPKNVKVFNAPYSLSRTGWGTFTVGVLIRWKDEFKCPPLKLEHNLSFEAPDIFTSVDVPQQ